MKSIFFPAILCCFLFSCSVNPQVSPVAATVVNSDVPATMTATLAPTITSTPTLSTPTSEKTPNSIHLTPVDLSPINAENINQIQPIFTYHVSWDALSYGLISISPDGKWLALAAKYSSQLYLLPLTWTRDNAIVPNIDVAKSKVYKLRTESIAFSPDSAYLAVADGDNSVTVFDLEHSNNIKIFDIPNWPTAVTFVRDSKTLAVGTMRGLEGSLQILDLETAAIKQEISKNTSSGGICSVSVSPDGKILAVGYCTNVFDISTWDIDKNYAHIARLAGVDEVGYCAHFCTDNRNIIAFNPITGDIASGTNYASIPVQDARSGKMRAKFTTARPFESGVLDAGYVNALAFTPDGALLVIATNYELQFRDAKDGKLLWYHEEPSSTLSAMAINGDARLLISINSAGDVTFWGVPIK